MAAKGKAEDTIVTFDADTAGVIPTFKSVDLAKYADLIGKQWIITGVHIHVGHPINYGKPTSKPQSTKITATIAEWKFPFPQPALSL